VPPTGVHRAGVVARPGRVGAVSAHEPAAAHCDGDGDPRRLERDLAHGGTRKGQKAVECGSDAHGQVTSGLGLEHLQPYGLARARRASEVQCLVRAVPPASSGPKNPRSTHIHFRSPTNEFIVATKAHTSKGIRGALVRVFRSKWAHEALTRENMSSWAHARTPTPKHSCSSEQIKQGHVPTSCGTPVVGRSHIWRVA
jgi:hypothetical protein